MKKVFAIVRVFLGIHGLAGVLLSPLIAVGLGLAAEKQISYKGKTFRIIVPVAPGAGLDMQSRVLAPLLEKYISGNPTVVVENVAGAGGIRAANTFVATATSELTILQCHIGYPLYQLLGILDVKYDARRWRFLGGTSRPFMPILQRSELPYKSISEWTQVTNPIVWSADTLGSTVENPARVMRLAGAKLKIVSGYQGAAPRMLAVLRGEADATPETLAGAKPHLDAGKLKVVGRLLPRAIPGYPDAPYALNAFPFTEEQKILYRVAQAPWHLQTCWVVKEETPKEIVQNLQFAVKQAITSTDYSSAMDRAEIGGDYITPEEILEDFVKPQLGIASELREKFKKLAQE